MELKSPILPLNKPKIGLWWCRLSDVSSGRQSLGNDFFLLTNPKSDLVEVEIAMFQGVACHFEHIFGLLAKPSRVRSIKRCFKGSHGTLNLFWPSGLAQNAIWTKSKKPWLTLLNVTLKSFSGSWPTENVTSFMSIKRRFKWSYGTYKSFSASWPSQNATLVRSWKRCFKWSELVFFLLTSPKREMGEVEKVCFKGAHVTLNSFSVSWPTQNATWVRSKKWCFKVSHGTQLILDVWTSPKCDMDGVEKTMFLGLEWHS